MQLLRRSGPGLSERNGTSRNGYSRSIQIIRKDVGIQKYTLSVRDVFTGNDGSSVSFRSQKLVNVTPHLE